MRRQHSLPVLILFVVVPRLASPQGEPLGSEFRVNTYTTLEQSSSAVAAAGADFVVVWHSDMGSNGFDDIHAQRFDSAGNPLGTEFRVNTSTAAAEDFPAVAANASGEFVVVWQRYFFGSQNSNVFGQRYDASGAPVGPEFLVSTVGQDAEGDAAVAVAPSGAFMVVWTEAYLTGPPPDPPGPSDVLAQRFGGSGAPEGPIFRVNTFTGNNQRDASVAADAAGNFIVVWSSFEQDGLTDSVYGQRYSASGAALGPEFRVNTYAPGYQDGPAVAADPSGNFVVAWTSESSGIPPEPGLFAQRFASSGAPLGPEFRVSTSATGYQVHSDIAFDGGGNFVVVWEHIPAYGVAEVFGQRYSSLGEPSGSEFRVNTTTTGTQRRPSVASTPGGTFLVTWDSGPIPGNSTRDVFGQRFGGVFPVKLQDFRVE